MTKKEDIIIKVKEIIRKYEEVNISSEDELERINISELSKVQISMEVERVFGIEFELEQISNIITVGDLVAYIGENS